MARDTCHGGRPSFPPPPVLGRSTLGAVDMPIGCALTFFVHADKKIPTNGALRSKLDVVRRCDFVALARRS